MKDFWRWFADCALPAETPDPGNGDDILPDGIDERDGVYFTDCCICGKLDILSVDLDEIPRTGYRHYCGRSPVCCP